MLFPILGLVGFAGVVLFAVWLIIAALRDKKIMIPFVGMLVFALLVGASVFMISREDSEPADKSSGSQSTGDQSTKVGAEVGLFNVTLTIPPDFVEEGMTQEKLDSDLEKKTYKSATLNPDGSVTYVMSKKQHRELMDGIRETIDQALDEMENSADYPNFVSIEPNKDYTNFKVTTKSKEVGLAESFSVLAFYTYGGMYNVFNGTPVDNVSVQFVNEASGEVIEESNSKDMGETSPDKSEKSKPGVMSADNISYDVHMTADGNMLVFFTNNNAEIVPEFDVEVTFYDKNKQMLGVDTDGHDAVLPNAKVVSTFDVPRDDNRTAIKEFDYEISIKAKDNNSYENLSSDLVIDSNTGNNGVVARFTNNSDKEIEELEVVVVYYKDGKVIGSDENEKYDIASGDYVTIEFYRPYDESSHVIDFDDYEIVVNQAHNFGLY